MHFERHEVPHQAFLNGDAIYWAYSNEELLYAKQHPAPPPATYRVRIGRSHERTEYITVEVQANSSGEAVDMGYRLLEDGRAELPWERAEVHTADDWEYFFDQVENPDPEPVRVETPGWMATTQVEVRWERPAQTDEVDDNDILRYLDFGDPAGEDLPERDNTP